MSDKTELPKEWQAEFYKIMSGYQKEEGEQEYYMYYDVDIPKMMDKVAKAMRDAMEKMLKDEILFQKETYRDEITIGVLTNLTKRLTSLTPTQDGK